MAEPQKKIYIDEEKGEDDTAQSGEESSPFKSVQFAYLQSQDNASYLVRKAAAPAADGAADTAPQDWQPAAKAALKKAVNYYKDQQKKAQKAQELALRQKDEDAKREKVHEEAKKIVITEDTSLPKAVKISLDEVDPRKVKLGSATREKEVDYESGERGSRVRVLGRVHRARKQKDNLFITLKDGYGFMQCILTGNLAKTYDAITLTLETCMELKGELREVPAGATAPLDRELHVDFFKIIGKAPGGDDAITSRIAPDTEAATLLDLRHLQLRGEKASNVMIVRDAVEDAFRQTYKENRLRKVSPPALVQTSVEGGSTLFKFNYYGEDAYLTQSSQLYLETVMASMGNVYCMEKSFRAEKSLTRRHLSEYTHIEAELDLITFDDLLDHLELVISRVIELCLADPHIARLIAEFNSEFKQPERPFKRMRYSDAIEWLREHNILNEEGKPHTFGDDIAEAAERKMTDIINRPVFLTHFPVEIKAFYMMKDHEDPRVTESVDVLMPGVGEIVGGSMRIWDEQELMEAYKRNGLDPTPYYWYNDQRKYGSSPHGGYGLGLERFLAWMCKQHTVRDCCLYPRFMGRCTP